MTAPAPSTVPTITDGVIVLDALRPTDDRAVVDMDDEAIRRASVPDDPDTPLSLDRAQALIEEWSVAWREEVGTRAFAVRRDETLVGVALARLELSGWLAILEVRIAPTARRHRLGTRAIRLVADYAVDLLGVSRLRIDADDANQPAQAMAASLGFKPLERPAFGRPGRRYYGLTHEEWEARSLELAESLGEGSIAA